MTSSELAPYGYVTWDDGTRPPRAVLRDCTTCLRMADRLYGCEVVSPTGIAHVACDGGDTACGHDATGDDWWWPM